MHAVQWCGRIFMWNIVMFIAVLTANYRCGCSMVRCCCWLLFFFSIVSTETSKPKLKRTEFKITNAGNGLRDASSPAALIVHFCTVCFVSLSLSLLLSSVHLIFIYCISFLSSWRIIKAAFNGLFIFSCGFEEVVVHIFSLAMWHATRKFRA